MAEPVGGAKKQNKTLDDALGVAELQESGANYEEAIRSFRGALELGPKGEDKARALRGVGSCLERLGRWKEAHSVLSDAYRTAEQIQSDAEICRIQIKLGKIELGQGNIDAAIRRGNDTLSRIDAGADVSASTRGFALNLLGSAHNRKGNLQESAHCFEQALSAFKDAGDVRSLALAYNNLGLIYKEKCEWARALEHLQVASNLQAVEGDYPKRRSGRHNLGVVHFRMGHLEEARTCFTEAEDIARGVNDPVQVIRALLGRAGVDLVQHRWEEALEELEQVLELCSEENYPREAALTYRSLGQLHQARGNLRRAKRCFEVAWRKAIEISTEGDLVRELLRLRAELELAMGRPEEAESLALRAEELATQNGDKVEIALSQVVLGQVRVVLGKEEGFGTLQGGHRQLRVLGSPLPLVQALMCEARLRLEFDAGLDLAETALRDAREILQPVGLTELEVESLLLLTEVASRRLDFDRATEYMDLARGMVAQGVSQDIKSRFDLAQEELEAKLVDSSVTNLGAYRTAGRLEELIESSRSSSSKIVDVLELLTSALEADGSALISLDETIETTTHRIGSAAGKMLEQLLVRENLDRPVLV
ncbi:MAG: tetratricopeptide repeat protein, partial [Candidatus Eisenbacteria bacterium]|nr:tetratricopeptide repeat protein [Candidatus Eisenbacteria bacterium]